MAGRRMGGDGTDWLFTKGSGATGMLYISSVSCPGFPTSKREQRAKEDWALDADKLCCVWVECTKIIKKRHSTVPLHIINA